MSSLSRSSPKGLSPKRSKSPKGSPKRSKSPKGSPKRSLRDLLLSTNVIEQEMFNRHPEELERMLSAANVLPGLGGPDIRLGEYLGLDKTQIITHWMESDDGYGRVDVMDEDIEVPDLLDLSEDRFIQILLSTRDMVNTDNFAGLRYAMLKGFLRAVKLILTSPFLRPNRNLAHILNDDYTEFGISHEKNNEMRFILYFFGEKYGYEYQNLKRVGAFDIISFDGFLNVLHVYKDYLANQVDVRHLSSRDAARLREYYIHTDPKYSKVINEKFKMLNKRRLTDGFAYWAKDQMDVLIKEGAHVEEVDME